MTVTSALPPLPPPLPTALPLLRRLRALLAVGFGVSIALHVIVGPLLSTYKPPIAETENVSMVSLSRRMTIKVPTPAPTKPPQAPPVRSTPRSNPEPRPIAIHSAPPQAHLKIDVFKTTAASKADAHSEAGYRAQAGSESGVPQGTLASAPPARADAVSAAPEAGAPGPLPSRTPVTPPPCASPNASARVVSGAEPTYPESARELAASGEVDVRISLSAGAAVTGASILHSSGNAALDQAAIRAARESTYAPDIVDCVPVAGTYVFHASFSLSGMNP